MYNSNREAFRQVFFVAWQKHLQQQPLTPIEVQLVAIIFEHAEYHELLAKPNETQEYPPEENPFIHMSLHLAIREQVQTNRPNGIAQIYANLIKKKIPAHKIEHDMMVCLAKIMWSAQESGSIPDEETYLQKLRSLYDQG